MNESWLGLVQSFAMAIGTAVFAVLWYLVRRRDSDRGDQVQAIEKRLHEAERAVQDLRLEVAKDYVSYSAMRAAIAPIERDLTELKADIKKLLAREGRPDD